MNSSKRLSEDRFLRMVIKRWIIRHRFHRFNSKSGGSVIPLQSLLIVLYDVGVKRSFAPNWHPRIAPQQAAPAILQTFGIRWFATQITSSSCLAGPKFKSLIMQAWTAFWPFDPGIMSYFLVFHFLQQMISPDVFLSCTKRYALTCCKKRNGVSFCKVRIPFFYCKISQT